MGIEAKQRKFEEEKKHVIKTYTIQELLETEEDSDDEGYGVSARVGNRQIPWQTTATQNTLLDASKNQSESYPVASKSDRVVEMVQLQEKKEPLPKRLLVVSPTANGVDLILDLLMQTAPNLRILRLGQSVWR